MKLNKRFKLIITALLLAVLLLITTSCGLFNDYPDYYEIFGTVFTVTSDGGKAIEKEVADLLSGKESLLSTQISSSDIFKINAAPAGTAVKVDALTFSLLELSAELYASSEGAFNPAVYPLVRLWRFSPDTFTAVSQNYVLPSDGEIQSLLEICDYNDVLLDRDALTVTKLKEGMMLDLGGMAKGYAVRYAADYYAERNLDALVNLGGNLCATGSRTYTIGITHPDAASGYPYFAKISLKNACVSTSGKYQRYYTVDGVRYSHILARDGKPSFSDVESCTVISRNGELGDALATAAVAAGAEKGAALIRKYNCSAIFILENKRYFTVNCDDISFELTDTEYKLYE